MLPIARKCSRDCVFVDSQGFIISTARSKINWVLPAAERRPHLFHLSLALVPVIIMRNMMQSSLIIKVSMHNIK